MTMKTSLNFSKHLTSPKQWMMMMMIKIGLEDNDNDDDDDDDYFSSFSHERTLMLGHFPISNEAIKGLAKKTRVLLMKNILGDANNIIPDIFQFKEGDLNELNELLIYCSEGIEYLVDISNHLGKVGTLFSKLLVLRLYNMNHLRGLWHGYIPHSEPFQNLEKLCVNNCPRLTFLFTHVELLDV
ncbi:hypothetical protein Fmac_030466 [Flemingia macrophylla]|uniref:Disease resistance protein At4g27190-like leucine-rich repeats domain-containing protein n=1 Tax=Flemingia macrophylla TaxID=520843 RepID=A0ABD1KZ92_9FABA